MTMTVPLSFVQPPKQLNKFVTPAGITGAAVKFEQLEKHMLMLVTLSGIVSPDASVRPVQFKKQEVMFVTLSGILSPERFVKPVQP